MPAKQTLLDYWEKTQDLIAEWQPSRLQVDTPSFIDYAWNEFDCELALRLLTSEAELYAGHRSILFTGLCAFVLCPDRPVVRRLAMMNSGMAHLREAERRGCRMFPEKPLLGDLVGRLLFAHADYFADFYYPVASRAAMIAYSDRRLRGILQHRAKHVPYTVRIMRILHHHALHFGGDVRYYPASQRSGSVLCTRLLDETPFLNVRNPDNEEQKWKVSAHTCSLIYAAYSISLQSGGNLLDAMLNASARYDDVRTSMPTLIARARYIIDVVLRGMADDRIFSSNNHLVPRYPSQQIPAPALSDRDKETIEAKFNKATVLGRRRESERSARLRR